MGKYIWPGQAAKAALWYLEILSGKRKLSIDAIMSEQIKSQYAKRTREQTYRQLEYLSKKGLVAKEGRYREVSYEVTYRGSRFLKNVNLTRIEPSMNQWDKKWRIVMFDIPENSRGARDHIRRLLKELGFKQLQLSVWVHPLPCLDHFNTIEKAYGIDGHLFLAETGKINIPASIVNDFQKTYPKLVF